MENDYNNYDNYNNLNDQTFLSDTAQGNYANEVRYQENRPKKTKRKYGLPVVVLSVILAAIVGAGTAVGTMTVYNKFSGKTSSGVSSVSDGSTKVTNINVDENADNIVEAVAQKVTPSVVGIATTAATTNFFGGSSETSGSGSGIVYSEDGYIITNYHVIESAVTSSSSKIEVYLSSNTDKSYPATVVGYNVSYDLAVIKISASGLQAIELGTSSDLKVGQYVVAIGSPGGLEFMGSATFGIISGLNRVVSDGSNGKSVSLIQTDAAINPGNSGGALVNKEGKLIGVNSSKIAATEYEGMGFAIPVDTVKETCDKIIAKESDPNPYIGVTLSERYTADVLTQLGYPKGAVVKSVVSGAPAYEAGIRSGDIIVEFNGTEISGYEDLNTEVSKTAPGSVVKVKIYRSRKYYTTNITIGSNNSQQ